MAQVLSGRSRLVLQAFNVCLNRQTILASRTRSGVFVSSCSKQLSTFQVHKFSKPQRRLSWTKSRNSYRTSSVTTIPLDTIYKQNDENGTNICGELTMETSLPSSFGLENPALIPPETKTFPQSLGQAHLSNRGENVIKKSFPFKNVSQKPLCSTHNSRLCHLHHDNIHPTLHRAFVSSSGQFVKHFSTLQSNPAHYDLARPKGILQRSRLGEKYSTASRIVDASPQSIQPYLKLIRMDKPIGTWLLYWPCTWSIALAAAPGTLPDPYLLALFGAGAFFMRGAGCIINDMWDKDFDEKVERTRTRPLANGSLTQFQALVFLGTQLSCALAILLQLNLYSVILGASSMALVVTYPLAKRYTYWPQLVLGLTLNWGVLLACSAVQGHVTLSSLALYWACVCYTIIYDTIYSHQDKYDDLLIGVKSAAIRLGEQTKPVLTGFTCAMAAGLVLSGHLADMTWPYYVAVALTTGRLAQQVYSTNMDVADQCAHAFRGNFYLGAIMFLGIVLSNYLKQEEEGKEATGDTQEAREGG
ncbi:hypothetical protein EGW08_006218, partial [Elysia chlorotica]